MIFFNLCKDNSNIVSYRNTDLIQYYLCIFTDPILIRRIIFNDEALQTIQIHSINFISPVLF